MACVLAFTGRHFILIRSRVPSMPVIRGPWLAELREDVVHALAVILLSKDLTLGPCTIDAAERGMKSIRSAATAVEALPG